MVVGLNWEHMWRTDAAVDITKGEKKMPDVRPAKALPHTASDMTAADSTAARDPEDVNLVKLSAALTGLANYGELRNGCWSDEPLRLADFVA